jgi:hypothetical protein
LSNIYLFVRSKESKDVNFIYVLSKNAILLFENLVVGEPYRDEVQSYYDGLVWNGIISFVAPKPTDDAAYSLFKIKGIEELQKVCNAHNKDGMSIEELLILAAVTNNLDYPHSLGERGPTITQAQQAVCIGAPLMFLYVLTNCPAAAFPICGTLFARDAVGFAAAYSAERPQPKF